MAKPNREKSDQGRAGPTESIPLPPSKPGEGREGGTDGRTDARSNAAARKSEAGGRIQVVTPPRSAARPRPKAWGNQLADIYGERWAWQVDIGQRYLHDRARAEDTVEETYVYLLAHPKDDKEIGAAYVDTCVTNQCIKVIERDGRDRERLNAVELVLHLDLEGVEIDGAGEDAEEGYTARIRWVKSKLRRLTPAQREVLKLALKGRTTDEIAQVRGITPSAVRSHRSDAIARLQAIAKSEKDGGTG